MCHGVHMQAGVARRISRLMPDCQPASTFTQAHANDAPKDCVVLACLQPEQTRKQRNRRELHHILALHCLQAARDRSAHVPGQSATVKREGEKHWVARATLLGQGGDVQASSMESSTGSLPGHSPQNGVCAGCA